jgi:hypothetical protein
MKYVIFILILLMLLPVTYAKNVTLRIDDISFSKKDEMIFNKSLELAKMYNARFDLAVRAKPFKLNHSDEVLSLYKNNKNIFEVVAHGYTHKSCINETSVLEFDDCSPWVQRDHIKKMKDVFIKYNMTEAQYIFASPGHSGNIFTAWLLKIYGYTFATMRQSYNVKGLRVSDSMCYALYQENFTEGNIEYMVHWNCDMIILHNINFKYDAVEKLLHRLNETNHTYRFISEMIK